MNLKGIVAVAGKPGLWKALAQNKTGFILESLDAQKTKLVANLSTAKIAALDEITIFGEDGDIRLTNVFERMKTAKNIPDPKDGNKMREFFREVAPQHDEERVYSSDMKKIILWFNTLKDLPLFNEPDPSEETTVTEETSKPAAKEEAPVAVEETAAAAPKKPKAKKK